MDLLALREATAEEHDATEAAVPLLQPELTRTEYARVLGRMYGFVKGWEQWAAQNAPADLRALLEARQRSRLLREDLQFLDAPVPYRVADLDLELTPDRSHRNTFLGALYVMEGSTLGGQYLAAHLQKHFGLQPGQGNAYFVGYGTATGSRWNEVRTVLKAVPDEQAGELFSAAKQMFAAFRRQMQQATGGEDPAPTQTPTDRESTLHP